MTEEKIARLFERSGLETPVLPLTAVPGGFLHRMYRAEAGGQTYAVKHLNPGIMSRPEAAENFRRAEKLEKVLEDAGLPVVPALTLNGCKMQELDGDHFYIFRWHNGAVTDWNGITAAQCRAAGSIQGRIHSIPVGDIAAERPEPSAVDWRGYIEEARGKNEELAALLEENAALLYCAQDELNIARAALPDTVCITDEDMDPKNVMWEGSKPVVIDLETLDYGSPVSSALQLSLQWAGVTLCKLDFDKLKAFFDGYLEAFDSGFRDYGAVLGLAYTWTEWLEYNLQRALGRCSDEAERCMGLSQVKQTIDRIRFIRNNEDDIRRHFRLWFGYTDP